MSLQAPAILDVRPTAAGGELDIAQRLRGIGVRQIRLACGLVLFSYVFSHFFNHALGNLSYGTMEAWLRLHVWWWRIPAVNFILYAAATTHWLLGLWALYQRRHFRYTAIEITQLVFGLSIPLLLSIHFGIVWLRTFLFDVPPPNYAPPLIAYWVNRPYMIAVQFALLTVAWIHGCIGLYFWLRLKPFFRWASPFLLAIAVLLPPLAMTGTHRGAHEAVELSADPHWRTEHVHVTPPDQRSVIEDITWFDFPLAYGAVILLVFAARGVRAFVETRRGAITISYPHQKVRVPVGLTVLEASMRFKVPHASVCGGKARCSTCRVRVVSDRSALPPPSGREAFVLARVGAAANPAIRLACQLRPKTDLAIIPVLPANIGADFVRNRQRVNIGEERHVVSMFVDMRGSTKLAEARLPYDTVFLVNRFLEAASQAVIDAGGQPNQFVGDGLLALFGLATDAPTAARQALRAAAMVAANVAYMNHEFASELDHPIEFGIGIHGGEVIIGDIGFRDHTVFTALGDAVNVAARLQDMTKSLGCSVIVSSATCREAGIETSGLRRSEVAIRGREQELVIHAVGEPSMLAGLLDRTAPPERQPDNSDPAISA